MKVRTTKLCLSLSFLLVLIPYQRTFAAGRWYGMAKVTVDGADTHYAAFQIIQWMDQGEPASIIKLRFEPGTDHGFTEIEPHTTYINRYVNVWFDPVNVIRISIQGIGRIALVPVPKAHYNLLPEEGDITISGFLPTRVEVGTLDPDYVFITILPR